MGFIKISSNAVGKAFTCLSVGKGEDGMASQ
jgi:hypothetical protein